MPLLASRQLETDIDSLKDEIRSDLEQFKNSLQPLFKVQFVHGEV